MRVRIHRIVRKVNVVHLVCDNVLGDRHSHAHRMTAGVAVMTAGVTIAKVFGHTEIQLVAYLADGIGYLVHGLGCVPFVDYLMDKAKQDEQQ